MSHPRSDLVRWIRFALSALLILAATLGVLEVTLRLTGAVRYLERRRQATAPENTAKNKSYDSAYTYDPYVLMKLKPNLHVEHAGGDSFPERLYFDFTTNDWGFRCSPFPAEKGAARLLAIGDSCTFGYGVGDAETWPAQVQNILGAGEHRKGTEAVEVVNAAVPGYTSYQGLRFLKRDGARIAPRWLVAGFGVNDCQRVFDVSQIEAFKMIRPFWWIEALSSSHLERASFMLRFMYLAPRHLDPTKSRPQLTPAEFKDTLSGITAYCRDNGISLLLLVWPMRCQIMKQYATRDAETAMCEAASYPAYLEAVASVGKAAGAKVLDLVQVFRDSGRQDLFGDCVHLSAAGYRLVAEKVTEKMFGVAAATDENGAASVKEDKGQ